MMELHFISEDSYPSQHEHRNKRDMAAEENENLYSTNDFQEENSELESSLSRDWRLTEGSTPARSTNNRTKIDLSGYHVTPRKMDTNDLIPQNNASAKGVIKADKNKPVKDIYLMQETQKNYITIPVESVDISWIKRIWE